MVIIVSYTRGLPGNGLVVLFSKGEIHFPPRMQFRQERRLPLRRNMGIDLRRGNGAVAEERLDIPDVHTGLQQRGGECMAEHMRRDRLRDMEPEQIPTNDPPHGLLGQRHFPIV